MDHVIKELWRVDDLGHGVWGIIAADVDGNDSTVGGYYSKELAEHIVKAHSVMLEDRASVEVNIDNTPPSEWFE